MILSYWVKCLDGDYRYSRKIVDKSKEETKKDLENWLRIYDTYLIKYGFTPKFKRILKAMQKKAKLEFKYIQTRDPFLLTLIDIEEAKLKGLRKESARTLTINQALIRIGKWYGSHLRAENLTVSEFEDLRQAYEQSAKDSNAQEHQRKRKRRKKVAK